MRRKRLPPYGQGPADRRDSRPCKFPYGRFFRPANMAHLDKESSISGMFKAADYYYPLLSSRD